MCIVLRPPGVNPIAVNKIYIISYKSLAHTKEVMTSNILLLLLFMLTHILRRFVPESIAKPYAGSKGLEP